MPPKKLPHRLRSRKENLQKKFSIFPVSIHNEGYEKNHTQIKYRFRLSRMPEKILPVGTKVYESIYTNAEELTEETAKKPEVAQKDKIKKNWKMAKLEFDSQEEKEYMSISFLETNIEMLEKKFSNTIQKQETISEVPSIKDDEKSKEKENNEFDLDI